jgi:biofilm protein TabA
MKTLKNVTLLLLFSTAITVHAQTDSVSKAKAANQWVKNREWAKGLKIKPDPSINSVEFRKQYESDKALWDKAFAFLGDSKLSTMAPGKYPIDGDNAFAIISAGPPKKLEDVKWESHRKYIDLQYVIAGKVKLGMAPVAKATVTEPYSDSRDAANYNADGRYLIATPKEFFLFFPQDAHRPDIKVDGADSLKKLVIKIKYKD